MANTLNFSNSTPAAPTGNTNVTFQSDTATIPNVSAYVPNQVNADWSAVSGTAQILNKPTIPAAQVNSDWSAVSGVAQILNKPSIPAAQVNADWTASSGVAQILNKPTLGTAAAANTTAFDAAGAASAAVAAIPVFGPSGASHSTGFVPDPGSTSGTTRYLREDSTWATPAGGGAVTSVFGRTGDVVALATDYPAFVASGASHAQGMVPDPGASSGTTKFLREDGTWVVAAQLNVAQTWSGAQTINQTLSVAGGSGIRTTALATSTRSVTAATDTIGTADHTLILNGVTTEKLPASPPTTNGVELYFVNVSASAVTIDGNGNSIWAAGTTTTTISLAAGATAILQWDYASTTRIWRQIK